MLTSACTSTSSGRDPSTQHSTADPGAPAAARRETAAEGLGTALSPLTGHLEHAQLADRAEAVLDRAHDAVGVMLLALEIQHRVDDVLERLGPGEAAVLGDVADEEGGDVLPLGREQQLRRRLADLADAARRRLELQREHGLDRVDDDAAPGAAARSPRGCARGRSRRAGRAAPRSTPSRSPRDLIWCSDSSPEL